MQTATVEEITSPDPTETLVFKCGLFLSRIIRKIQFRVAVETARLLLLGFYEDFLIFVEAAYKGQSLSPNEKVFQHFWQQQLHSAGRIASLLEGLEPLDSVRYKGTTLRAYLISPERWQRLQLFVEGTRLEEQGEEAIARAREHFLSTVSRHRLTRNQRSAILEKYRDLGLPSTGGHPSVS